MIGEIDCNYYVYGNFPSCKNAAYSPDLLLPAQAHNFETNVAGYTHSQIPGILMSSADC